MFKYNDNFITEIEVNKYGEIIKEENEERSKFDYIISNPPYQKTAAKRAIWPAFIDKACKMSDNVTMIHPGRWVVPMKNMRKVRDKIIDNGLYYFNWYTNATEVFSSTSISGGVTVTCFRKGYKGDISYGVNNIDSGIYNFSKTVLIDDYQREIFDKVWEQNDYENILSRVKGHIGTVNSWDEFTSYDKYRDYEMLKESPEGMTDPIKFWGTKDFGNGGDVRYKWFWIDRSLLTVKDASIFEKRKIMFRKTGQNPDENSPIFSSEIQIVDAEASCTGNIFVMAENDIDYELELLKTYFETKTVRFLLKIGMGGDRYIRGFENVPDYTYFIEELNGELFTDEFFYNKFNFSEELINHIEKVIKAK